jgi:NAD-dependent dihydropyrimidine dehydrogenase PreA subunit
MPAKPILREDIPWFPTVDAALCTGCRVCFEYCVHGVYEWDAGRNAAVVARPFQCVVGCSGCQEKCAAGAISFPELEEIAVLLRRLRQG